MTPLENLISAFLRWIVTDEAGYDLETDTAPDEAIVSIFALLAADVVENEWFRDFLKAGAPGVENDDLESLETVLDEDALKVCRFARGRA